jgi:hypothetical protein
MASVNSNVFFETSYFRHQFGENYGFSAFHKPSFLSQINEVIRLSIANYQSYELAQKVKLLAVIRSFHLSAWFSWIKSGL